MNQTLGTISRSILALILASATLWPMQSALAAPASATYFTVPLAGASETPDAGDPDGSGTIHMALDPVAGQVCYVLYTANISAPAAGHIHVGAEGTAGGVAVALFSDAADAASGCAPADAATINAVIADPAGHYVNIHNNEFGGGAIRGQLDQPATTFTVTVANISGSGAFPGPFAPGLYAVHDAAATPLFDENMADRGDGLEGLAEDGSVADLAAAVATDSAVRSSGIFNTPLGADTPGPIFPGDAYQFQFQATNGDHLSLATMLVQTNDTFIAPAATGLALFDGNGDPISGDITGNFPLWDAGTERNEPPGMGPNQAPRQAAANTGPAEGAVSSFTNTTRGLPLAGHLVNVSVVENSGTFSVTVENISGTSGALGTPIAPVFFATHNQEWTLFNPGAAASAGLEELAEDGSPTGLVGEHTGATGIGTVGAQPITNERPADGPGPAAPGESYTFSTTPTLDDPYLSMAMMVVQTNDVFLASGPMGIALLDFGGDPRPITAIEADIRRSLALWDAGTEANEVPGVGPNQAPRQPAADTGDADPNTAVRLYNDATNDLAGGLAGGFAGMTIEHGTDPLSFVVTLNNTSDTTAYPGILTPVAYAVHDATASFFQVGDPASAGIEALAEDGDPAILLAALGGLAAVSDSGAAGAGPIIAGGSFTFNVTASAATPLLSIASMVVPSNDTFLAFGPGGIALLDANGDRRSEADLAADVAAELIAWDAGTEQNQAGAGGPDQAPRQTGPNTGADEGSGLVRQVNDPVWDYPQSNEVVRITIEPQPTVNVIQAEAALPADGAHDPMMFAVRVENISGNTALPSPFAPGVWAVHDASRPFFSNGQPDRGQGLAALAEDGSPVALNDAVSGRTGVAESGIFNTPDGANAPAPIFPGEAYEFMVTTTANASRLSLATMFVQSNDLFVAPAAAGIELFDVNGDPLSGDITDLLELWDVGSERNEAPGMGPNQAPRQAGAGTGPSEGRVAAFNNTTRGLPLPQDIVDVAVRESNGEYTVVVTNVSATSAVIDTPIAPVFFATHDDTWRLFESGGTASAGLEELAEDGSPAGLVGEHSGAAGTGSVGAQPITDQRPNDPAGPMSTGESYTFSVTPTADFPALSMAMMVVQTNDAFLTLGSDGVMLLDSAGAPRAAADVAADIKAQLAVWDAGTEANEVPGVGPNQAPRQPAANTGPADADPAVRHYSDPTNDLAGAQAGGFANLTVTHGANPGSFVVTLNNSSAGTAYPGVLTPVLHVTHNDHFSLFTEGMAASAGLESLAEDGSPAVLLGELATAPGVDNFGVQAAPVDAAVQATQANVGAPGPIADRGAYSFIVTPNAAYPSLSIASMIVPSNDTFLAFGPAGLRLLDENGDRRSEADIAADIAAELIAWDAGTEQNQAGAAGPDQAPRQSGPDTGASEGDATVRAAAGDIWRLADVNDIIRVTLTPMMPTGIDGVDEPNAPEMTAQIYLPFMR